MSKPDAALMTLHSEIARMRKLQREYRKKEQAATDPKEGIYASGIADAYSQLIQHAYELMDDWAALNTMRYRDK